MIPHKQLFKHDPANGIKGDCWRTCIACLLDLPVEDVPHSHDLIWDDQKAQMKAWLAKRGLCLISVGWAGPSAGTVLGGVSAMNPGIHFMFMGESGKRGYNHIVIAKDGGIVHDTSGSGIIGPCVEQPDGPYYWVEFIGRLV